MTSKVLIILVNFRRPKDTIQCVLSLLQQTHKNWVCSIYENGSQDNSYSELKSALEVIFPVWQGQGERILFKTNAESSGKNSIGQDNLVLLVKGDVNLGFAGGNNAAFAATAKVINIGKFDYFWFLNNDTVVEPAALDALISRFEEPGGSAIGLCGSTLLYFGSDSVVQCFGGAAYSKWLGRIVELGQGEAMSAMPSRDIIEGKLSYVSGASTLASKRFIETVGLMSPDYFLYFEELDWAQRGKRQGFALAHAQRSVVWHKEGSVLGSGNVLKRSALAEFYGLRSRLRFTMRHHLEALPTVWLGGLLQLCKRLLHRQWRSARALLMALTFKSHY